MQDETKGGLMRFAIYFTTPENHALTKAAETLFGRSAFSLGKECRSILSNIDLQAAIQSPRRYGFHATLKAPFKLRHGLEQSSLRQAMSRFVKGRKAFQIGLKLARIDGFFALVSREPSPLMDQLAADCVTYFDEFRAPLDDADRKRRKPETLTVCQRRHLERWGYPYVFDQFQFHMTLTSPVSEGQAEQLEPILGDLFREPIRNPIDVDCLALFVEQQMPGDFFVESIYPF